MPSRAALAAASSAEEKKISDEKVFKVACDFVRRKVTKNFVGSTRFTTENFDSLPSFTNKELKYGKVLGRGGFGIVNEVKSFTFDGSVKRINPDMCKTLANQCGQPKSGEVKYAIKQLGAECQCDANKLVQGIMDMAVETYFLASLSHPNIIKLRANRIGDIFHQSYFVIMDKLTETLEDRLLCWKKKSSQIFRISKDKCKKQLYVVGLDYGIDIASAIDHLHGISVIYRDLKSENIGFDSNNTLKVFDFGLAKELHPENVLDDGTYKLTGGTGSMRYMAPEVYNSETYNISADIYSFGMLLWEILAMEKPFEEYSTTMHRDLVIGKGYRPMCKETWDKSVNTLMSQCWKGDKFSRPTASEILQNLKKTVYDNYGCQNK